MGEEICQDIQQKLRATDQIYLPDIDMPLSITKGLFNMLDTKRKQLAKARNIPEIQYDFEDLLFQLVIEDPPEEVAMQPRTEGRGRLLKRLIPMSPTEGPPLPRFLKVKWPWKEDVEKKLAKRVTKGISDADMFE